MPGYCTVDDVRRVLQRADLDGALGSDNNDIVVRKIQSVSGTVSRATKRHWYVADGIDEDDEDVVSSGPLTRDDEHDIPTHGALVHGASETEHRRRQNSDALLETGPTRRRRLREERRAKKREIRIAFGDEYAMVPPVDDGVPAYTRIRLERKDVDAVNELHVVNADGGFDDWADGADFDGGVGNSFRGDDFWVRVNNRGWSELYLDVHSMDDDLASFSGACYVDIDYGADSLPMEIRDGVAQLVAAELADTEEFKTSIPDQGQLINVETKAERWERLGWQDLAPHVVNDPRESE